MGLAFGHYSLYIKGANEVAGLPGSVGLCLVGSSESVNEKIRG